jgi:hypothetical protein
MMTGRLLAFAFCGAFLAGFVAPRSLAAADGPLSCIEEIGVPTARPYIFSEVPATVQVTLTIGADGKAERMTYIASSWLEFELQHAFVERARYSPVCKGQRLTFEVRYEVVGEPTVQPESVTRFLPPNRFVVICHPIKGSVN